MDKINLNELLDREKISQNIKELLINFEKNKGNLLLKRSIYIYGTPGSGKTQFITNLLKDLNYDVIKYDAGDIRNKNIIDTITRHNMSDTNVISMFQKKKSKK
jgi:Cdc6-like AAA superfamily ATPase